MRTEPDGYTMLLQSVPLSVNKFLFPSLSYDPIADLATVTLIHSQHHGGAARLTGAFGQAVHRLRERQQGQGHVRVLRSRNLGASLRRAVQAHGED